MADLSRVTAALNAYPWTSGAIAGPDAADPRYCAVGLLLRYAGVPRERLACSGNVRETWLAFRDVLAAEYGIEDYATVHALVIANDTALSHDQAIEQVQRLLAEPGARGALLAEFIDRRRQTERARRGAPTAAWQPPAPSHAPWLSGPDDGGAMVPVA